MIASRTQLALAIFDTDDHGRSPGITPYKAALIAGITPQALYAALRRREPVCSTCGHARTSKA